MKKLSSGFLTRSDTNQAVQPQKMGRGLKFRIKEVEVLYTKELIRAQNYNATLKLSQS